MQTIVTDYENIASSATSMNSNIQGSHTLTTQQQQDLVSTIKEVRPRTRSRQIPNSPFVQYTSRLASVFEVTGSKAGDFEIPADQNQIETAATDSFHATDVSCSADDQI